MAIPALAMAQSGAQLGGKIFGGVSDIIGGNKAANAQKRGLRNARSDLTQGFDQAQGFQQPIYDQSLGAYSNLGDRYSAGDFSMGKMSPFEFDPQSVFQDPEYQASMKAGNQAISSGAQARGMLYSGDTLQDLNQFGQDTFARRSDALYNRGFNAQNTAFDQNYKSNLADFEMGQNLAAPLQGAANNLSDLATNRGSAMADNSLGRGDVRAQNILRTSGAIGGMAGDIGSGMSDLMAKYKLPGVNQPKGRL